MDLYFFNEQKLRKFSQEQSPHYEIYTIPFILAFRAYHSWVVERFDGLRALQNQTRKARTAHGLYENIGGFRPRHPRATQRLAPPRKRFPPFCGHAKKMIASQKTKMVNRCYDSPFFAFYSFSRIFITAQPTSFQTAPHVRFEGDIRTHHP